MIAGVRTGARLGVAVGTGRLTGVLRRGEDRRIVAVPLDPAVSSGEPGPALREGFDRLAAALAASAGDDAADRLGRLHVHAALLPPLCDARLVELPPLRADEAEAVVRRQAARHFVGRRGPIVVGVERVGGRDESAAPVLAVAASAGLVEALHAAVRDRGWCLEAIVAGQAAWLEALRASRTSAGSGSCGAGAPHSPDAPDATGGPGSPDGPSVPDGPSSPDGPDAPLDGEGGRIRVVVAEIAGTHHLLRERDGAVDRLRRLPDASPEALLDAAGRPPGRALVLASREGARSAAADALVREGWVRVELPPLEAGDGEPGSDSATFGARDAKASGTSPSAPGVVAARFAFEAAPELVPPSLARLRRARSRRLGLRLGAAALLVLAAAAGAHLWSTGRTLRAIQAERAEIREAVAPALAARDSLDEMQARLDELRDLDRASARWTFSLVELSVLLPSETHLVSLRAAGDTVVIEAAGGRAGEALAALRAAPTLRDVRLEGTIQREIEGGATSRERFTLSALLARRAPSELAVQRDLATELDPSDDGAPAAGEGG